MNPSSPIRRNASHDDVGSVDDPSGTEPTVGLVALDCQSWGAKLGVMFPKATRQQAQSKDSRVSWGLGVQFLVCWLPFLEEKIMFTTMVW